MEQNCEIKYGQYLSFKQKGQERFTRGRSLGLDYTEESIKFRIENKHIKIEKKIYRKELIDKSQAKFQGKENIGLRYWATMQNINTLSAYISQNGKNDKEKITQLDEEENVILKKIDSMDAQIKILQDTEKSIAIYKQGYGLIKHLKASIDKAAFKKEHYKELKEWDKAKKILSEYKTKNGTSASLKNIQSTLADLKTERSVLYLDYQEIKKVRNKSSLADIKAKGTRTNKTASKQAERSKKGHER